MMHVVLFEPEIPGNTGNIIRLCANTGAELHLIEPLGFELEDSKLRRAGLDYHEWARVRVHADWEAFLSSVQPDRVFAFTTKTVNNSFDVSYQGNDALLFGPESRGLPAELLASLPPEQRVKLPMHAGRSLNLSNAVAIAVYEGWRQQGFAGVIWA
ncbi:MAG: tRNA (cytidine(34)-2'-O)-methyltransferase [Fluviicoccus sp.]|uniref:tRNA (cytidine(34)-2'-O)-methyltransferase n=1 Tax=Fluviicoccus sp. TaxID=2003552 RepID=UPI00271D1265|nr:tRNA (cytidine(34)-2'-O)-methyltransferase [Fluviicoccus sp.]MDO8331839.1 tRNA (cytidine(34)-2'-O)-methyltransferase [Fluviicoccus sp.]